MAGARERPQFNIVVREIVNRFQPEELSQPKLVDNSLLTAIVVATQKQTDEKEPPEAETLFDDSDEADDEHVTVGTAKGESRVCTGSSDDAIFNEIETPVFEREPDDVGAVGDKQNKLECDFVTAADDKQNELECAFVTAADDKQKKLQCAFVTAAGKTTSVSYETLQAARKRLEVETPTASPTNVSSSSTKVDTGFKSARGNPMKVSTEALSASSKVFAQINDEPPQQDNSTKDSVVPASDRRSPPTVGLSAGKIAAPVLGFMTARGNAQKVSEKALREVRKMFKEEFPEIPCGDAPQDGPQASCLPKDEFDNENNAKLSVNGSTPGVSSIKPNTTSESKVRSVETKTPVRRIAGLKRRTPMCQTGLNRPSSPITPLRDPSKPSNATPLRPIQQEKPVKKPRVINTSEEKPTELRLSNKIKLRDLTLLDRPAALAGSSWFRDDVSGRKVYLDDVKRSFRREINVRTSNFGLWFANHFEMVVWKLASYSGRIKEMAACLTVENVLDQLKHRWNVEAEARRSPLRMIVERDAPSEATMVLLVKEVRPTHLVLSDGWYSIPCDVDEALQKVVAKNSIRTGQKLCVCGAQLKGAPNGVDPLQLEDARLSIRFNSTRRARWFARMGYLRKSLLVPLSSIKFDGGCLPAIRVSITSSSSLMFFEKFSQGGSIIRREADELKEQRKYCEQMLSIHEKVREDVLKRLESERTSKRKIQTRSRGKQNAAGLTSGAEIFDALENSLDPVQLMEGLSSSQRRMLESYRATAEDKFRARLENETRRVLEGMRSRNECPEERKVAPLLKFMVRCAISNVEVPLTVWRPSEDLRSILRVGATITIHKANVTTCRKFAFSLTTTKGTAFELFEESLEQQKGRKQARLV